MKKKVIIIGVITLVLVGAITLVRSTLAVDNSEDIETYDIVLNNENNTTISVPANSTKTVIYKIHNDNDGTVQYEVVYNSDTKIIVAVYEDSEDAIAGLMEKNSYKFIKFALVNKKPNEEYVTLSTVLGYEHGGDIIFPSDVNNVKLQYPLPTVENIITNIYTSATKTTITKNAITYNYAEIYDIDDDANTLGGLMNDRLGGVTEDLDGGNIRYYGENPSNYIYFNCDDYEKQSDSTCEKWRIIGIFDGKAKIIRSTGIGDLAWDQQKNIKSNSTSSSNNWTTSSLQILLNGKYYDRGDTTTLTYYTEYSGNGVTLNLSNIGLKNKTTRDKIAETTWYLGGWNSANVYPDQIYGYERGDKVYNKYGASRPTTWVGKIALMYPSDYGYAAKKSCIYTLANISCNNKLNNYLYDKKVNFETFLTPNSDEEDSCFGAKYQYGDVNETFKTYSGRNIRPTLFLNPEEIILDGDGTENNPYQLSE